jgi:hypothetical protein
MSSSCSLLGSCDEPVSTAMVVWVGMRDKESQALGMNQEARMLLIAHETLSTIMWVPTLSRATPASRYYPSHPDNISDLLTELTDIAGLHRTNTCRKNGLS